jgi:hypothetical protein
VDPGADPLLLRKSGSAGNRIRISGPVAMNPDYYTTGIAALGIKILHSEYES